MNLSEDIRHMVDEYVHNHVPIYLLHLPDMKLVHRKTMKQYLCQWITEVATSYKGAQKVDDENILAKIKEKLAYAILSHRWFGTGEVSFEDIQKDKIPNSSRSSGYMKLWRFCREAFHGFGCEWAWADTCCIDGHSSADLEESIRSMFSWYRNAKACIVYLGDVENPNNWQESVWFSRGWTLQELLAPKRMKFFVKDWKLLTTLLNDKDDDDILQTIRQVTGIPVNDLRNFEPQADRIREKMTWASKRNTTRVEDKAYCLIGILDVSLTISYGEGERAFFRLQVEIIRNSLDWGLLLWNGQSSKYNSALAAGPECFIPVEITSSISDILMGIAADIATEIVYSSARVVVTWVNGNSWTRLQCMDRVSVIFHRDREINAHYLSRDNLLRMAFATPGTVAVEVSGDQHLIMRHGLPGSHKFAGSNEVDNVLSRDSVLSRDDPPWFSNFEETKDGYSGISATQATFHEISGDSQHITYVTPEGSLPQPSHSEFLDVGGDLYTTFVLSSSQPNDGLIRFCCRDLARNSAAVLGLGSALLSDLEVGFDADDDEHLRRHVLFHIEAAFDPAIDEATRRINMALKELDPNLERCTAEIQSRVRRDLKVQYGSVFSLSPSVLQALHERKLTSLSSQTSFELTQRGLRLELPMLEVREVELLETKNSVYVYKLDVPCLRGVLVETTETLRVLSQMTLKLAILDFKEYAGFNILNELGPKQDNHHQALVLRLLRADMTQYRKVATECIVHVRSYWGNNFETWIQTVYVK